MDDAVVAGTPTDKLVMLYVTDLLLNSHICFWYLLLCII